jgi:hypothetical protein
LHLRRLAMSGKLRNLLACANASPITPFTSGSVCVVIFPHNVEQGD